MATMIPNDVEEFQTEGERVFFRFLQSIAKPDSRHMAWYLLGLKGKYPDFLLYGEDVPEVAQFPRLRIGSPKRINPFLPARKEGRLLI
jgi:hypothetical protein